MRDIGNCVPGEKGAHNDGFVEEFGFKDNQRDWWKTGEEEKIHRQQSSSVAKETVRFDEDYVDQDF